MPLTLFSGAFTHQGALPRRFTCDGANLSPPLFWSDFPESTQSFALVLIDPDAPDPSAPTHTAVHWIVYNIPVDHTELPEDAASSLPAGAAHGTNGRGEAAWWGPCPSIGEHRYIFQLYALDTRLDLQNPTRRRLLDAMDGHILAKSEIEARYGRTQVTAGA